MPSHDSNSRLFDQAYNAQRNFYAFLWHASFYALASSFMDVDTVIPSMLIKAGGSSFDLGVLTAIMLGGSSLFQLLFAGLISGRSLKKGFLLWGINLRVVSLSGLALVFWAMAGMTGGTVITLIFLLITLFSLSGAFANVSYIDILGKSVLSEKRKRFFSLKQVISSVGVFASAIMVRELLRWYSYPVNYFVVFIIAASLLGVASGGFWTIREPESSITPRQKLGRFFAAIPSEIRKSKNLKYYLLVINSLGLGMSLIPFIVLYAKTQFGLKYEMIGNFLLLRTLGALAAGIILFRYSRRYSYRSLLQFSMIIALLLPLMCMVLRNEQVLYEMIFILAGIFVASYRTAINGVLLEISNDENRAFYAGMSGAGNILTAIFPILAGWLIPMIGFGVLFSFVMAMIVLSLYFIRRINCVSRTRVET